MTAKDTDNVGGLRDEIESRLTMLQIGTCSCGTKTPEARLHLNTCKYRAAVELRELCRVAPAGSGEVEDLIAELETISEMDYKTDCCNDDYPIAAASRVMRTAAALLRKLQQGYV